MSNKKRSVIVKVGPEKFVKYEYVNDLVRFTAYLDSNFPSWRYYNVFDRETRTQIGNFTTKNRPVKHI